MLGPILLGGEQPLGVAVARGRRPGDRVQRGTPAVALDERLGRGADERDPVELQQEEVRRGVHAPERPVDRERRRARRALGPLREDDLERVARTDVLLRAADALLVDGLLGEAAERPSGAFARRDLRQRAVECRGHHAGVADEHLRHPGDVVEADERLRDDEARAGERGPVRRERHRRLQPGRPVVAHVADDRLGQRLRLVEEDEPRARADERVAPEPAPLDRLQQERRPRALPQAEVGAERRQEVGVDGHRGVVECLHGNEKRPSSGRIVGADRVVRRRLAHAPAPPEAPSPAVDAVREGHRGPA